MYRGTTPTHRYVIPFSIVPERLNIAYSQEGEIAIEKALADVIVTQGDTTTIEVQLTEEDTLALKEGSVAIQVRIGTSNGARYTSQIMRTQCFGLLKDGLL